MLKALRMDGALLVLGLNPKEIQHLKEGNPIRKSLEDIGAPPGSQVILFMGDSDEDMKKRFERSGLATPNPGTLIDLSKVKFQ